MLTWTPFIDHTPIAQENTDMQQRRDDLEIRSLLEFPALRAAMGLDTPTVVEATAVERVVIEASVVEPAAGRDIAAAVTELVAGVAGGQARKRQPKRTPKAASAPRANKGTATRSTARTTEKQHPRFDRRALLESDRVA